MKKSPVGIGKKFGQLTVLAMVSRNEVGQTLWDVRCSCGIVTRAWGYNLVKGKKTVCGGTLMHVGGEKA